LLTGQPPRGHIWAAVARKPERGSRSQ
jgi:hypothetical protein